MKNIKVMKKCLHVLLIFVVNIQRNTNGSPATYAFFSTRNAG